MASNRGWTPWLQDVDVTLWHGDVLATLRDLPAESVDCVVTSPPYWALRDYGTPGQLGLEPTPEQYVERMVEVFREVRRVLAAHGTVWLNLGDSYAQTEQRHRHDKGPEEWGTRGGEKVGGASTAVSGLKPKDLCGIPWRVAFALQADGWYLRSDIIWAKPNPMPESVTDRPTKAHEYVFLLSKQPRYFFDQEAVRERYQDPREGGVGFRWHSERYTQQKGPQNNSAPTPRGPDGRRKTTVQGADGSIQHRDGERWPNGGRNIRSVWEIATQPYPEAHFATFPEELARRCIAAGCPEQVCRALVCKKCDLPHPTATVDWLWNAEAGRHDGLPEQDAIQEALRRVREALREQESLRVQSEMSWDSGDEESRHEAEGRSDQPPGLHPPVDAGLPVGDDGEGLRAGTSLCGGAAPGPETGTAREGASPQRGSGGQPPVELGDRDPLDAPWRGRMPELRDALLRSLNCACGASEFRVCGKARERIVSASYDNEGRTTNGPRSLEQRHETAGFSVRKVKTTSTEGFTDCGHADYRPGIVLDPFMGSGTVAYVARKLGRHAVGIDLSEDYLRLAARRLQQQSLFAEAL